MQYLTVTKSLKKLHTLEKQKYSQCLFDQSSFESLKILLSRQLAVIWPDAVQSMQFLPQIDPIQSRKWSGREREGRGFRRLPHFVFA